MKILVWPSHSYTCNVVSDNVLKLLGVDERETDGLVIREEPRLFFSANDDAVKLAKALRAALHRSNVTHN